MGNSNLNILHQHHPRDWRNNLYVYPVMSRRSHGLSIGINLNPDKACNFDCIYCQVDRRTPPVTREVDLAVLESELQAMLALLDSGQFWMEAPFSGVPADQRRVNDIAFSGDGEPTTCPQFADAVEMAARSLATRPSIKIVLITDACYLMRPAVKRGLAIMDAHHGEIWAKLDAGTEEYYRLVNRPNYPLRHVLDNILDAARVRPVVIQSIWMRVHGQPPPPAEIDAFGDRLQEIAHAGGRLSLIQVYTIARDPTEAYATPLSNAEVDDIAGCVSRRTGLRTEAYYSS